ncbi:hypothetical protein B0I35DRAFT_420207 [Stachybotrys elegans]|uniref:Cupin type-2 domain-containing protein n=1 Tax=Stachybotrys elegans TaxID=80388 RepID=A0A8K0T3B9_9HYPO|nr:hypothetical protein B0I35DRAFT_420207 [Stachybotrys elegans]
MPRTRSKFRESNLLAFAGGPTEVAFFEFVRPSSPENAKGRRIITIPPGSTWSTGLHWHEEYTESVRVLKGRACITIDGSSRDYTAEDGVVTFPRLTIHGFGRADSGRDSGDLQDVVLEEWVDPEDGFKLVFFYNILGALQECQGKPSLGDLLQLGTTLAYIDEYPVIPLSMPFFLRRICTHVALAAIYITGRLSGYKPWVKEYTPMDLWDIAQEVGKKTRPTIGILWK